MAKAAIEIEQTRLLCLHTAHLMDLHGNKVAKDHIAMIKIAAPQMAKRVIDAAMQAHGAVGLSNDLPMAHLWAWARICSRLTARTGPHGGAREVTDQNRNQQ